MFNSHGGEKIVTIGGSKRNALGVLNLTGGPATADYMVGAGFEDDGRPKLFVSGPETLAGLALDEKDNGMLEIGRDDLVIAGLGSGPESGGGLSTLYSANGQPMVEAGSTKSEIGSVRAYGPTGKCDAASGLAGIAPCYIAGR